ncbi:MAG: response regulator [Methylococcales bacterium]|nr:response regulator [Methylococcales bacterium]
MKRITLIDDNQINLTLLWHLVKKIAGYEAASFLNPVEALAWSKENEAELIIVDYMMPEMNGIDFITQFRQSEENIEIPILMVTANDQLDVRYQALKSGATDFLNKPIDKSEFSIRVTNLLALRSSQKKLAEQANWLKNEVTKATQEIRNREQEIIYRLTKATEYRDPETGGHIKRMAHYSYQIAMQLGMSTEEQSLIFKAAPMHDIGKVGIPDSILLKPGELDYAEFEIMKEHAQYGYNILNDSPSQLMQIGAEIALSHHEKYDGSGYPNGLKGDDISIYGRIVAVADVFDALTSERPYKKPWAIEEAICFLTENEGKHFDRACVQAFLKDIDVILDIKDKFKDVE